MWNVKIISFTNEIHPTRCFLVGILHFCTDLGTRWVSNRIPLQNSRDFRNEVYFREAVPSVWFTLICFSWYLIQNYYRKCTQNAPQMKNPLIAPWGLWYRAPRFFMFVCLSVVCCCLLLSRSDLIENGTRKSASSEGTMEKFDQKTVPFLDMSCRIHPVTSVASLKMLLMSNYLLYFSSTP